MASARPFSSSSSFVSAIPSAPTGRFACGGDVKGSWHNLFQRKIHQTTEKSFSHIFSLTKFCCFAYGGKKKKSVQKISITDEEGALRLIELYRMLLTQV